MIAPLLAALLAFSALPSAAQSQTADQELGEQMKYRLQTDPALADSLADRINRSSLGAKISDAQDAATRQADIRRWIDGHLDYAAGIALGLAKDDAQGNHDFEAMINRTITTHTMGANPDAKKNVFGRLNKSSSDSKLMNKDEKMADEEKREILKNMFEGKGSQTNRIVTQQDEKAAKTPAGAVLNSGYYDRLSKGNLRGYSPQLQTLQSELNSRRVPGAPKLIETGKLDYETLSYPGYSMRYDIANLDRRLRYERNFALARLLGREREFSPEQLLDPAVESALKTQAAAKGLALDPHFARRQAALDRAAAAVKDFDAAALPSRDPLKISRALLQSLGGKQKEAARWITDASLEEELQRLETIQDFLGPELLAVIARAPVDEGSRVSYKRRGEDYKKALLSLKSNDESAISLLESDGWLSSVDRIEQLLTDNSVLRKDLTRNIGDYVKVPYRLDSLRVIQPRWRDVIDDLVKRFLPGSAYAQRLKAFDGQRGLLRDVFIKIATGNLDAAHTILASYEPSAGPPSKR